MSGKRVKKLWAVGVGWKRDGQSDVEVSISKSINPPKVEMNEWGAVDWYSTNATELVTLCATGFRAATGIRIKLGEVRELFVRVH